MRVLLVEDQTLFVEALQQTLESEDDIEVVGVCSTVEEASNAVAETNPDMVIVDVGLPDGSGLELGREILERHPETKVVVLTARDDATTAREAHNLGLHGYLTKESKMKQLLSSIIAVNDGHIVMPAQQARAVGRESKKDEDILMSQLTPREREVLGLLMEGASSKDIAKRLSLRVNTARTHVQNVLTKLQVHSRLEATAYAARSRTKGEESE